MVEHFIHDSNINTKLFTGCRMKGDLAQGDITWRPEALIGASKTHRKGYKARCYTNKPTKMTVLEQTGARRLINPGYVHYSDNLTLMQRFKLPLLVTASQLRVLNLKIILSHAHIEKLQYRHAMHSSQPNKLIVFRCIRFAAGRRIF